MLGSLPIVPSPPYRRAGAIVVTPRLILRISSALLLTTLTFAAAAAPKDAAATSKIDEAINTHYLATDFAKAESQLLGVVKACGKDGCSPGIVARAWMYVGLVRGSGKEDLAGAKEAFAKAKEVDGTITLDTALATPNVQKEFDAISGGASGGGAGTGGDSTAALLAAAGAGGGECTPAPGSEIETRRSIPISCKVPEGVTKAVLAYKEFGGTQFTNLPMALNNGQLRAPIPCSATKIEGALQYVVVMKDAAGTTVGSVGTLDQPAQLNIVKTTTQAPPSFPGEAPPSRCAEEQDCPPGMPGCSPAGGGGWGDSCTPAEPCKKGLYCAAGTCENAPSCELDSDCDSGRCSNGFCDMGDTSSASTAGGNKIRKIWVGLHGAADVHFFGSGKDVCSIDSIGTYKYSCYYEGRDVFITDAKDQNYTHGIPDAGQAGSIGGGMKLATFRILASLDYAVIPNLTVGGRLGFALNGGPPGKTFTSLPAGQTDPRTGLPYTVTDGSSFMPIHAEGRATWWFKSLGQPGIRPYIAFGGGLAQVDAKITVPIIACSRITNVCGNVNVDVYKRLGMGFVAPAAGAVIPLAPNFGIQANVNAMFMLPVSGIVVEPSLGAVVGF